MWLSPFFWKQLLVTAGAFSVLVLLFTVGIAQMYHRHLQQELHDGLLAAAETMRLHVAALAETEDQPLDVALPELADVPQPALTIVAPDGRVLATNVSEAEKLEDQRRHAEIRSALGGTVGTAQRRDAKSGLWMHYVALPVARQGKTIAVVRVGKSLQAIHSIAVQARILMAMLVAFAAIASLALAYHFAGRLAVPLEELQQSAEAMANGEFDQRVSISQGGEIGALAGAFNRMRHELAGRFEMLRQRNETLDTVLQSMVEGVIAVDNDQRVLLANDASRKLLHLATPEIVGRPLLEATRSRPLYEAVLESRRSEGARQTEFEVPHTPRRRLMLRAARLPGRPSPGAVAVLHDVTELRRLENLRKEFVANVSHELKTPLSAIKGYAETLRLGAINDGENNLRFVQRIETEAERLHQLILDLLQIARVESHQEAFEITNVSLGQIVEYCFHQFAETALAKGLELRRQPPDSPVVARADEEGLQTILSNLLDNAIKYTPQGGAVTVSWRQTDGKAVLQVADTGVGIPKSAEQRVFERFFRVDKARSRELGGTGLGLSIVKHLTHSFGGSVELESQLGKGSTFSVRLPLGIAEK